MMADYIYCPWCGYEDCDVDVVLSSTYANGDFYLCPECGEETSHVENAEVRDDG